MRVTEDIGQLLGATIRFANLRRIRSTRQVEELFEGLPIIKARFKILRPGEQAAYRDDQNQLRAWLQAIATGKADSIAGEVHELLGIIPAEVAFDRGARELAIRWAVQGARDCYALGTAALLSKSLGLMKRLGYCDAPKCGRFRLDLSPRGRPWRYCNAEHRQTADVVKAKARVRRYRRRQEDKKTAALSARRSVVKSVVK